MGLWYYSQQCNLQSVPVVHNAVIKVNSGQYEKVSDQGPVWVRFEDKIPGVFISTHDINFKLSEYSLDP